MGIRGFFKRLKFLGRGDKVFSIPEDVNEVDGPVKIGEVWQVGNRFFQVHKILTKGRIVVKPTNIRAKK